MSIYLRTVFPILLALVFANCTHAEDSSLQEICHQIAEQIIEIAEREQIEDVREPKLDFFPGHQGTGVNEKILKHVREKLEQPVGPFYFRSGARVTLFAMTDFVDQQAVTKLTFAMQQTRQGRTRSYGLIRDNGEAIPGKEVEYFVATEKADFARANQSSFDLLDQLVSAAAAGKTQVQKVESYNELFTTPVIHKSVEVKADRAQPSLTSQLDVALVDANSGQRIPLRENEAGVPQATLGYGDEFHIAISNAYGGSLVGGIQHGDGFAVRIAIDGISTLSLSEDQGIRSNDIYYLPHRKGRRAGQLTVDGWYKTAKSASKFKVVPEGEGLAAQLSPTNNKPGIITILFYPAWQNDASKPNYGLAYQPTRGAAIGLGEKVQTDKELYSIKYDDQTILAAVTIKYDGQ